MKSLDPVARSPIRGPRTRSNIGPFRNFTRTLAPIGRMDPDADMLPLVEALLLRIKRYRHQTVAGTAVLGDEHGNVYVLAEGANTTAAMVAAHKAWLVRWYAVGDTVVYPSAAELLSDLRRHFVKLLPAMVYEAIRREEG